MKTPMQEHIEWLKKEWKKLESVGQLGVALHIGDCIEHAESMLEKEEEKIMDAYDAGLFDGSNIPYTSDDVDDNYFNKTFNTKLTQDTDGCSNDRSKCSCKNWGGCPVD
jgi:bacterioferritin-associated ferredoxin